MQCAKTVLTRAAGEGHGSVELAGSGSSRSSLAGLCGKEEATARKPEVKGSACLLRSLPSLRAFLRFTQLRLDTRDLPCHA